MASVAQLTAQLRYLLEYVTYNTSDWKGSEYYKPAIAYFNNKYLYAKLELASKAAAQLMETVKSDLSYDTVERILSLGDSSNLELILAYIAQGLDEAVLELSSKIAELFQEIVRNTNESSAEGLYTAESLSAFVKNVDQALALIGSKKLNRKAIAALTQSIGSGTSTSIADFIKKEDLELHRSILCYLEKAVLLVNDKKFNQLTFYSLVSNIFNKTIGETMAQLMLSAAISSMESTVLGLLTKNLPTGMSASITDNSRLSGTEVDSKGKVSKVDILNGDSLKLTASMQGTTGEISISSNASVKWHTGKSSAITVLNSSNLMQWIGDGPGRYYAYNILTHRKADPTGFKTLKAGVCASYLNEWLAGSGGTLSDSGINTAQYLIANGRVYSIYRIVKMIADELATRDDVGGTRPVNINITSDTSYNKWQGNYGEPNWELAILRSNLCKEVTNSFKMTAYLNAYVLKRYAATLT